MIRPVDFCTTTAPTGEHSNEYYGILTVKDDGSYKFTANTALDSPVDKLGENAEYPITVKLYANDGLATTTSSLTITIKGRRIIRIIRSMCTRAKPWWCNSRLSPWR